MLVKMTLRFHVTLGRRAQIKETNYNNDGEDVMKGKLSRFVIGGSITFGASTLKISVAFL